MVRCDGLRGRAGLPLEVSLSIFLPLLLRRLLLRLDFLDPLLRHPVDFYPIGLRLLNLGNNGLQRDTRDPALEQPVFMLMCFLNFSLLVGKL